MKRTAAATLFVSLLLAPGAWAAGNPDVAALQVGLRQRGFYGGTVDGVLGPVTVSAVRRLQRRARLAVDGVPGPRTKQALGRFGRKPRLGGRILAPGSRGWDVAALQFAMAAHGFPSGRLDGLFGASTGMALRRFQGWVGLQADGVAGPAVVAALRAAPPSCPISLASPVATAYTDVFGPRGNRFHTGIDYPGPVGNVGLRRGVGPSHVRRVQPRWLGEPRDDLARKRDADDVRAPLTCRGPCRPVRPVRPAHRQGRVERELHGAAPALRGAGPRCRRRPDDRALRRRLGAAAVGLGGELARQLEVEAGAGRFSRLVANVAAERPRIGLRDRQAEAGPLSSRRRSLSL